MAKTHDDFVKELSTINPEIEVIGQYTRAVDRIEVKCKKCGKVWNPVAYSLTSGKSCPHCSAIRGSQKNTGITGAKTDKQFRDELRKLHPDIEPLDSYISNKDSIRFACQRCGHEWSAKPYSLLQGHGCPRCAKSGTSFMEQFILLSFQKAIGKDNVLSRDKSLIGMELDIYIPDLHIAIEPGNWFLHRKSIKRDRRKRELCSQKQVDLITIYDKYPISEEPPFDTDCITFSDDYNKADHSNIKNLVRQLFARTNIEYFFSDDEWSEIENEAYDNALSKTHDNFVAELKEISPTIQVIGQYQNANKRLLVKCMTCGYKWNAVPANLLSGDGCRKCGSMIAHEKFLKTQEDFVKEVEIVNPTVEVIGNYTGRHSPIKARCKICGFIWEPRASSLLRGSSHKGSITMHKSLRLHNSST